MTVQAGRASSTPPAARLVGAALVGAVGLFAFSFAVGSFVVGSSARMPVTTYGQQVSLLAGAPFLILLGFAHLVTAAGLAAGGRRVREAAAFVTLLALIVAATRAATLLVGIDPAAGQPTTQSLGIPVLATVAYGLALLLVRRSRRD